jgi:hypothetical protein
MSAWSGLRHVHVCSPCPCLAQLYRKHRLAFHHPTPFHHSACSRDRDEEMLASW